MRVIDQTNLGKGKVGEGKVSGTCQERVRNLFEHRKRPTQEAVAPSTTTNHNSAQVIVADIRIDCVAGRILPKIRELPISRRC